MTEFPHTLSDPLQYRNLLRFPRELERAYRQDYARKMMGLQRGFLIFGLVLYGLFGILDHWAMPDTYPTAWALRAAWGASTVGLLVFARRRWFEGRLPVSINLWVLTCNVTILGMIVAAEPGELAYTFYPIGLMLPMVSGYVISGHLWSSTAAGWLTIGGYLAVGGFVQQLPAAPDTALQFFTLNFFLVAINIIGMMLGYLIERAERRDFLQRMLIEQQRRETDRLHAESERLLLNVLPAPVADRLKRGELIADSFDQTSILFADIVGSTHLSAQKTPAQVVTLLNEIFSGFDQLSAKYGVEKIKTIGDAYMAASGVPTPNPSHLETLVEMALEMQMFMQTLRQNGRGDLKLRVGIACGSVVAGVIGHKKFSYDLWGDTVNLASRMESLGIPDKIQVTGEVYRLLRDRYTFEERSPIWVKGKGEMVVYLLTGRKEGADGQGPAKQVISGFQDPAPPELVV